MAEEYESTKDAAASSQGDLTGQLLETHGADPEVRALIQLIPGIGSSIDVLLSDTVEKIRADRMHAFFDELAGGNVRLSPDLIRSEDFLHCYFATLRAATRSRRRQKTRYLARLLRGGVGGDAVGHVDDYEEMLSIIDELSYRELLLLAVLAKHERAQNFRGEENELQRAQAVWPAFIRDAEISAGVPEKNLRAALTRLARSGCFEPITGAFFDYEGGMGRTTPLYERLEVIAGSIADLADASREK